MLPRMIILGIVVVSVSTPAFSGPLPREIVDRFLVCVRQKIVAGPYSSMDRGKAAIATQSLCQIEFVEFVEACEQSMSASTAEEKTNKCLLTAALGISLELERAGK